MFRILVAEDDDSARFLRCEVLRRAGYEPCPARDGVEALEVMEHYQCDLAVVDITMPRMDGITFTRTLREGNCDLPVLMVTARVTQEDKRRGFRAGCDDYMVKPVDEEEMLWRIEALLRRYRSTAERRLPPSSSASGPTRTIRSLFRAAAWVSIALTVSPLPPTMAIRSLRFSDAVSTWLRRAWWTSVRALSVTTIRALSLSARARKAAV